MPPGSDGPVVAKDGEVVIRDDNGNVVFLIRKETGDVFVGSSERSGNFFVESADGKHAFRVLSFGPKVDVDIGTKLQPASVTLTGDFLVADSFAERRETGGAILTEHSFRYDRVRGVISLTDKLEAEGEPGTFVELEPGAEPGQSISLAAGKVVQTLLTVDQTGLKIIQGGPDLSTGAEEEASFGGGGIGVPGFAVAGGRVELGKTFEGGAIPGFLRIVGRVFPDEVSSVPTTFVDIDGAERKIEVNGLIICAGSAEFGGSVQAETVTAQQFIDGDGNVMGSFDASKPIGSLTIRDLTAHKLTSIGHTKLSTVTANVIEADDITVKNDISLEAADCAEFFDVATEDLPEPGTVMVAARSDGLLPCRYGYDTAVVGVVSGASDRRPGIVLGKRDHGREGALVALTGTVYCKADADHAPINVGDLLTTSPTVGHAMKAVDPSRRSGAVIGKALRSLSEGCGMVPVIVSLQ